VIHIVLWKWRQPNERTSYDAVHVNTMVSMLHRNMQGLKYRIICITDDTAGVTDCETYPLWQDLRDKPNYTNAALPSCYRRLRLYDHPTQLDLGIRKGDRIVSIDLDALITGPLKDLLQTPGRFVGWQLRGAHHDVVFNGSFQMFTAGDLQEIWSEFDPATSPAAAFNAGYLGSDQSWLSWRLAKKEGSVGLKWPQVASYPLNVRLQGLHDARTRIVFYHGKVKPWDPQAFRETKLSDRYWR